jgi:hypothetical protein
MAVKIEKKNQNFVLFWLGLLTGALLIVTLYSVGTGGTADLLGNLRIKSTAPTYSMPGTNYSMPGTNYSMPGTNYTDGYSMPGTNIMNDILRTPYSMPGTNYTSGYSMPGTNFTVPVNYNLPY